MDTTVNGIRVHCEVSGTDGTWVVFAHSLASNLSLWKQQVRGLAVRHRVLCYDARGPKWTLTRAWSGGPR